MGEDPKDPATEAELERLREQVRALADANALAAELMAELEEARAVESALRRRAEELQLQHSIDEVLRSPGDERALCAAVLDILLASEGLDLEPVGLVWIHEGERWVEAARTGDGDALGELRAFGEEARKRGVLTPWVDESGHVSVPLGSGDGCVGCICLRIDYRSDWVDRWLGLMRSFAHRVGTALDRIRITNELAVARDRALEASVAKSHFLANMSHELRTPLNAIIGYGELLREEAGDDSLDHYIADLDKIIGAGRHLLGLINDILDLSKVEAGKMDVYIETFDLRDMLQSVADTITPLAVRNGNRLELSIPEHVGAMRSDEAKIRQNLLNLLSNASKFTNDGTIRLEARRSEDVEGERVIFTVTDTGIGMTEEHLQKVFEAFTQADSSTTRKFGGTGLGLAITQRFCHLMGGDITVRSELGVGTTFEFWLPATLSERDSRASTPEVPAVVDGAAEGTRASDGRRILVIDDDPNAREMLARVLANRGYEVHRAASGEEGLRLARDVQPHAITLDVMMPGRDGWNVLGSLKSDPDLAAIPVIMVTIVPDRAMGMALGAADYLVKPVEKEALLRALERQLAETSARSALIVDDDPDARLLLRRTLEKEGWSVEVAENGQVALERIRDQRPSLVLLDLMMPVMDGFTFLRTLRSLPEGADIPVVVLTARRLTDEERESLRTSVHEILEKQTEGLEELQHIVEIVQSTLADR